MMHNVSVLSHQCIMYHTLKSSLRAFSTDTAGELNVLGHDGNALCMDGTEVRVLEETHEVGLGSLLKGKDGRSLESKVTLKVLGNLTHKTLEGKLTNEEVS